MVLSRDGDNGIKARDSVGPELGCSAVFCLVETSQALQELSKHQHVVWH